MGADLIGYFLLVPDGLTQEETAPMQRHLMNIARVIAEYEMLRYEEAEAQWESYHRELFDLLGDEAHNMMPDEEDLDVVIDYIKRWIGLFNEHMSDFGIPDYRDVAAFPLPTASGRNIWIAFTGDMSWGDSPDGTGYRAIEAAFCLGIGAMMYNLALETLTESVKIEIEGLKRTLSKSKGKRVKDIIV